MQISYMRPALWVVYRNIKWCENKAFSLDEYNLTYA